MMQQPMVAVIGAGTASERGCRTAEALGQRLAALGLVLVCGGRGGIMEAAARGCRQSVGEVVGILPGSEASEANPWVSLAIPTGLGHARNVLVVQSARAVIAVEGEYGTLSEIAIACKLGRPVFALNSWSQVPGVRVVASVDEAIQGLCGVLGLSCENNEGERR
ncbi:MAG: TIGR00725 family protein [Desulfuromonadaceae bacterium]|nr:TIGR00725 family protein [Desulfuromonadaceae bacterium]